MITKRILITLLFINSLLNINGQTQLDWVREVMPFDSMAKLSVETHSSILPQIRLQNSNKNTLSIGKTHGIVPLLDGIMHLDSDFGFRLGGGAIAQGTLNNFFYRAGGISGIATEGSINSNRFEFANNKDSNSFVYFQPIVRLSYTPNHIFNFQLGHDRNFIGEGNRSLFLSDFGKPYTFGQIRAKFWHVEYLMMYQLFNEELLQQRRNKYAATHYLSWNVTKRINLGVFESVIFQPRDTLLYRGFDVEYLNPVVLFRPQEYAMGSADNVQLGASFSVKHKSHTLYGQLIIDEFLLSEIKARSGWWANKYGGQIGLKGFFKIKNDKFFYRFEANSVRPYTYSHVSVLQNYGNQNSTLSHPYGANFTEILGELKWQQKKWFCKLFMNFGIQGLDKDGKSYGGNVYLPYTLRPNDFHNVIGQGVSNNFFRLNLQGGYKISDVGNLYAFGEILLNFNSALVQKSSMIPIVGIRSYLWNDYRNY